MENATQALRMRRARRADIERDAASTSAQLLGLEKPPQRLECFDISHTAGEGTVASCVVYGPEGPIKKEYRRFNITGVTPGDDYGALRQALRRRYERVKAGEVPAPDVLLIDGGLGQINEVYAELEQLGFAGLKLVGVAKGPDRKAGQERLIVHGDAGAIVPGPDSQALARGPAHSRRGASLRHHRPSQAARAPAQRIRARDRAGTGARQAPRAAAALRRHAGTAARGRQRLRGGERNRDNTGAHPL